MYDNKQTYRVRYADVDQMGYMYYGNYAKLYEIGRVESLRNLGIRYKDLEESGIWMPVYDNYSKYIKPAKYDDLLEITCILRELPRTRITFECEIRDEEGTVLNLGKTTLVFIDAQTKKIIPCPTVVLNKLEPFFGI